MDIRHSNIKYPSEDLTDGYSILDIKHSSEDLTDGYSIFEYQTFI